MAKRKLDGLRAIVTGASSGIGRELARQLSNSGVRLVLTARRTDRLQSLLEELPPGAAHIVPGDITSSELRTRLLRSAESEMGGLDLLINNAGLGAIGPFQDAGSERLREVMEVNFFAPVELIRVTLPTLRQGTTPMIVNVGSVLGHRAVPDKSEYCASKFALHGISDALRAELASSGIDVLLASPSTTSSEFFDRVIDTAEDHKGLRRSASTPARVARHIVRAIRRGRHEVILSAGGKLLVWFDRLCPSWANHVLRRK